MEELWSEVDGFPNYAVSNFGEVVNLERDLIMSSRRNGSSGYLRVSLSKDGSTKDFYVHRLVATHFLNIDPQYRIQHVDGDIYNNRADNLRARRPDRPLSEINPVRYRRQRPYGQRVMVVETGEVFRTAREVAHYIGGDFSSVYAVLKGRRRSHMGFTFRYYEEDEE